jgi:hypothetical protein
LDGPLEKPLPWQYYHQLFLEEEHRKPGPCRSVKGQVDPQVVVEVPAVFDMDIRPTVKTIDADFGKERAEEKFWREDAKKRLVRKKGEVLVPVRKMESFTDKDGNLYRELVPTGQLRKAKRTVGAWIVSPPGAVAKPPCFTPSVGAARALRDKDASPFDQDRE